MNRNRWFTLCAMVAALAVVSLMLRGAPPLAAEQYKGPPRKAKVYVYPEKLTAKDKLSFGPGTEQKEAISIKGETTLVYVDLAPQARFEHPTQGILISTEGAQVIKGNWWLVLNGKDLFRDGKEFKVDFPINLVLAAGAQPPKQEPNKESAGPVVNGLKLSLSADRTETIISKDSKIEKPIALKLTFTNVGDKPIKFNAFDFQISRVMGEVKAMPADSVKTGGIIAAEPNLVFKAGDFPEIKPGQTWSYDKHLKFPGFIPEGSGMFVEYIVVKPGEFRVKFTYNSPKVDDPLANGIWIGKLVSNEIVINVKEANGRGAMLDPVHGAVARPACGSSSWLPPLRRIIETRLAFSGNGPQVLFHEAVKLVGSRMIAAAGFLQQDRNFSRSWHGKSSCNHLTGFRLGQGERIANFLDETLTHNGLVGEVQSINSAPLRRGATFTRRFP